MNSPPHSDSLVSIVIPSFNQGEFLEASLQSVLQQDYPAIELFVMDGGSSDNSIDIIRRYSNSITLWVSEKDRGQSHAINKGFKLAKGKYINWLCSDDILLPGAIRSMVNFLEANPLCDAVFGNALIINSRGETIAERREIPFDHLITLYALNYSIQPSALFKRSLLEAHGYVREDLHFTMDHELWLRFYTCGARFGYLNRTLSGYRYHTLSKGTMASQTLYRETRRQLRHEYGYRNSNALIESAVYLILEGLCRCKRKYLKLIRHGECSFTPLSWTVSRLNKKGQL
jgi:glycosyltransferase involved in cell wall biosynthesis